MKFLTILASTSKNKMLYHRSFSVASQLRTNKMEKEYVFGNDLKVLAQLIPETGENNYQYLISNKLNKTAISIDCFNHERLLDGLGDNKLICALATHHHYDHVLGIYKLKEIYDQMPIYAADERVSQDGKYEINLIKNDESLRLGSFDIDVIQTPCHTQGSVCYHFPKMESVFTGDTIFCGSVGKFFEGTADQMLAAVNKIKSLCDSVQIFPGHEYTVSNLKYAAYIDESNKVVHEELKRFVELRQNDMFTIPSSVGLEKKINPFFRVDDEKLISKTGGKDDVDVMRLLREKKNGFKP